MAAVGDVVVLDASVLVPVSLCDWLLRCAEAGLYQPRWTLDILDEMERNLASLVGAAAAVRRRAAMSRAFEYALVMGYEPLNDRMMNHPKDRHVLAAAVVAKAHVIVTNNLRDFPTPSLAPYDMQAISPDRYFDDLLDGARERVIGIVIRQAADLRSPPATVDDVLDALERFAPLAVQRSRDR